ncbi:hypothetical protein GJAV_G00108180 [Gymnothorax javanicus]|nr:hypothetical protein GJAV_G00108180 [Gymnothorax javanicus]
MTALYYVFEINQTYNRLTLDRVDEAAEERAADTDAASPSSFSMSWNQSLKTRLLALPFWLWMIIFLVPYLQVFLFLYSCTRPDPRTVGYCILPIFMAMLCDRHQTFAKASNQISRLQLIDT